MLKPYEYREHWLLSTLNSSCPREPVSSHHDISWGKITSQWRNVIFPTDFQISLLSLHTIPTFACPPSDCPLNFYPFLEKKMMIIFIEFSLFARHCASELFHYKFHYKLLHHNKLHELFHLEKLLV